MDVVFFGSGPVAAKSLSLLAKTVKIEAVITKPIPSHHRGDAPVIDVAKQLGLKILTAKDKTDLSRLIKKSELKSKLAILIDFGIIVTQDVIDYFPLGIVNSHFSLLPRWRGADPISFALLSGDSKTGVSLMLIDKGMDTGKLIAQKSMAIKSTHTGPSLTNDLIKLSNELLSEKLGDYARGKIAPKTQPHPERATYSRKLTKKDGEIDWSKPARTIEQEIRAFIEWPKSHTKLLNKDVVLIAAEVMDISGEVGEVVVKNKQIIVGCSEGSLKINKLKPVGKKEMTTEAFLAGYGNNLS